LSSDDAAYRKSVRNMSLVLAAIVITVFAGLFIPPYLFPSHDVFVGSTSSYSPYGLALHLQMNTTSVAEGGTLQLSGWLNNTSSSPESITTANNWGVPKSSLWGPQCSPTWPVGLGVMQGHYTQDNYTQGVLLQAPTISYGCPNPEFAPSSLTFEPFSSKVIFVVGGTPGTWNLLTELTVSPGTFGPMSPGVYTAVFADEFGDVLTAIFEVT